MPPLFQSPPSTPGSELKKEGVEQEQEEEEEVVVVPADVVVGSRRSQVASSSRTPLLMDVSANLLSFSRFLEADFVLWLSFSQHSGRPSSILATPVVTKALRRPAYTAAETTELVDREYTHVAVKRRKVKQDRMVSLLSSPLLSSPLSLKTDLGSLSPYLLSSSSSGLPSSLSYSSTPSSPTSPSSSLPLDAQEGGCFLSEDCSTERSHSLLFSSLLECLPYVPICFSIYFSSSHSIIASGSFLFLVFLRFVLYLDSRPFRFSFLVFSPCLLQPFVPFPSLLFLSLFCFQTYSLLRFFLSLFLSLLGSNLLV